MFKIFMMVKYFFELWAWINGAIFFIYYQYLNVMITRQE